MAVAFDAVSAGTHVLSPASISITIGASATALTVEVTGYQGTSGNAALTTHTVTVGATPLTLLNIVNCNNATGSGWVEMWGLISPPHGAQTITVTEKVGTTNVNLNVTAVSYTGVSRFGTAVVNFGTASTMTSGAIVSLAGNMVISAQGIYNSTISTPSGTNRYLQPTSASSSYVTMLVEDAAGAASVTLTSAAGGFSRTWGVVSVNLVAGTIRTMDAALALTMAKSSSATFVGRALTINASLALTTTRSAAGVDLPLGPALRYVGRYADSDSIITHAQYVQDKNASVAVTPTWIDSQVNNSAANLVTSVWVNEQVANYETKAQVDSSLGAYVPTSQLSAHSGIAQLDSGGHIPAPQLPTLITNSLAKSFSAGPNGSILLGSGVTHTVTTSDINEFVLATVNIPNVGYTYRVLPFAYVQGHSGGTDSGSRLGGNGNTGYLTVTLSGTTTPLYGVGVCTDDPKPNFYLCTPYGLAINAVAGQGAMTPATLPALTGANTLQFGACCFAGNSYVFSGTGMYAFVLVVPAVGS